METREWDVFISHASEDKEAVARPLAAALRRAGARIWLDEHELTVGDSLTGKIDEGLARSQFGVVILSPAFFAKHWPRQELAGLRARQEEGRKVILPVWHNVDKATVSQFSPPLADALAANTAQGIDNVARALIRVIFPPTEEDGGMLYRSARRRLIDILESEPDKETLAAFLRFHSLDERYLGWTGEPQIGKFELGDVVFDAYAIYEGHGLNLTLVYFTDVWKDPFEDDPEGGLKIRGEITGVASRINLISRRLRKDFSHDPNLQTKVLDLFESSPDFLRFESDREFLVKWLEQSRNAFRTRFFVYAGRRSEIDSSTAKHDMWSELRDYRNNIFIRSYDSLLDAIRPIDA
jgi:TIR domain